MEKEELEAFITKNGGYFDNLSIRDMQMWCVRCVMSTGGYDLGKKNWVGAKLGEKWNFTGFDKKGNIPVRLFREQLTCGTLCMNQPRR